MTDTRDTYGETRGNDQGGFRDDARKKADDARRKAMDAYDGARDSVASARRRSSDAIDDAPLIALAGGLAVGALIASLLPRTRQETDLLRPVGQKISDRARAAASAAKDAGRQRLEELGLTQEAGADKLRSVVDGAGDAARTSAQAAMETARRPQQQ